MAQPLPQTVPDHKLVRVLIVDDTPRVLQDLRQLLELSGAVEIVGEASDGAQAVRLAEELSPQVVVMDLEMPGMDGYEATRRIKARVPAARVVILSVHASPAEMDRARLSGADSFVTKGARYEILLNAILAKDGFAFPFNPERGA
jgi:two-component system, NarL family, response regulator DesR